MDFPLFFFFFFFFFLQMMLNLTRIKCLLIKSVIVLRNNLHTETLNFANKYKQFTHHGGQQPRNREANLPKEQISKSKTELETTDSLSFLEALSAEQKRLFTANDLLKKP